VRAANLPTQRRASAKLLTVDGRGMIAHRPRVDFADLLHAGDLVVANDAATLPASLAGWHEGTGRRIEVRLAGRNTFGLDDFRRFSAVVFGLGDFRMRTEDRPTPPAFARGDRLRLGLLRATVMDVLNHPRLILLEFDGTPAEIWECLARHGRPIQYSHVPLPLAIWDTWTPIAGLPVAFEPPSAGFVLDWKTLSSMRARGIQFATITHAAGISSTGDAELDALLPFDEPYFIPASTARAVEDARRRGGRVIAIGTTVVRALEHCAAFDGTVRPGEGMATNRIGRYSVIRVVDAIVSGTHEPGTSHYELLRAFINDGILHRVDSELTAHDYRTHEFGDSVLVERTHGSR
jgi:S-adenosylmethionine:tRNA ribosyltransferase-isomerase